jgi:Protein of unknown function (DUF2877)
MTVARALRAGPGAARALRGAGTGQVEIVLGGGGGYVSLGHDRWVQLAHPRAQHGPLSLHVASLGPLAAGIPARVTDGGLEIDDRRIALAGVRVVGRRRMRAPGVRPPACGPCRAELRAGVERLARGDVTAAVDLLAGRGEGLTPAGDDVLAGYAGWMATAGSPVRVAEAAADRTTGLSLAYLRCAERGELPAAAEALIAALARADAAAAARSARTLARWGVTSGRALMLGMDAAARRCRARPAPAPRFGPGTPSPRR